MQRNRVNYRNWRLNSIKSNVAAALIGVACGAVFQFLYANEKANGLKPSKGKAFGEKTEGDANGNEKVDSKEGVPILQTYLSRIAPSSPITLFRPNEYLEIAFDARTRNPVYVVERLIPRSKRQQQSNELVNRIGMNFVEEKSLPPIHRSRNSFFYKSGYDRGHLAPAADFSINEKLMRDTFSLCNVSPQTPALNRKVWSRLETLVRQLVDNEEEDSSSSGEMISSYVVTGPLWLPSHIVPPTTLDENGKILYQYSYMGLGTPPSLLQIPTHFFKVLITVGHDKQNSDRPSYIRKIAAFVIPNSDFDDSDSVNLQDFIVKISDLEAVSGMVFFPYLWNSFLDHETNSAELSEDNNVVKKFIDLYTEKLMIERLTSSMKGKASTLRYTSNSTTSSLLMISQSDESSKDQMKKVIKELNGVSTQMNKMGFRVPNHYCDSNACNLVLRL